MPAGFAEGRSAVGEWHQAVPGVPLVWVKGMDIIKV